MIIDDTTEEEIEAAFGDADLMGITEEEVDAQCDELFETTPIKFKARKNEIVDKLIQGYIKTLGIKVPVVWIKGSLYLIGSQRLNCELRADQLVVRVGGGYKLFEDYVSENHRYFMRMLVIHMIKSGESLENVIELLIQGKRITNIQTQMKNMRSSAIDESRMSRSPSRKSLSPMRSTSPRLSLTNQQTSVLR